MIGDVEIGDMTSLWFNVVVRGDIAPIRIGNGTNIQDGSVLHTDRNAPLILGDNITVGHNVVLHGSEVGSGSLIGMNAVVLSRSKIGKNCLIGANSLVPQGTTIPDNSFFVGSPGVVKKTLTPNQIKEIQTGAEHYKENMFRYLDGLQEEDSNLLN